MLPGTAGMTRDLGAGWLSSEGLRRKSLSRATEPPVPCVATHLARCDAIDLGCPYRTKSSARESRSTSATASQACRPSICCAPWGAGLRIRGLDGPTAPHSMFHEFLLITSMILWTAKLRRRCPVRSQSSEGTGPNRLRSAMPHSIQNETNTREPAHTQPADTLPPVRLLRLPEVVTRVGLRRSAIEPRVSEAVQTRPLILGAVVGAQVQIGRSPKPT